jgi:hypothetical protein
MLLDAKTEVWIAALAERLFGRSPAYVELRAIPGEGKFAREWVTPEKLTERAITLLEADIDVRFGPAPRRIGSGSARDITGLVCHWADIDRSPAEAEMALSLLPRPTIAIESGRGMHCYWALDRTLLPTPRNSANWWRRQAAFAQRVGGDEQSRDVAHLFRLPGTWNAKRQKTVRLVELGKLYSPEYLDSALGVKSVTDDELAKQAAQRVTEAARRPERGATLRGLAELESLLAVSYTKPHSRDGSPLFRLAVCPSCLHFTGKSEPNTAWIDFAGNLHCWRASCPASTGQIHREWIPLALSQGQLRAPFDLEALYNALDFG